MTRDELLVDLFAALWMTAAALLGAVGVADSVRVVLDRGVNWRYAVGMAVLAVLISASLALAVLSWKSFLDCLRRRAVRREEERLEEVRGVMES